MCTIIGRDAAASSKKHCREAGFTLPELLVALCICTILLQSACEWHALSEWTETGNRETRQALWLAQNALAGGNADAPDGWQVQTETRPCGTYLTETAVTVTGAEHVWQFTYVGETPTAGAVVADG